MLVHGLSPLGWPAAASGERPNTGASVNTIIEHIHDL
jgi:hypothetical protein